ncbi:hypothetical protein RN50_01083 [Microbacterium foliorum]|uniref:Uncharacterized protein n=1 Tax=Microbacterium foliorum TaxID=104336 RepID=A0A0F0KSN9_9MICO|nr:hypothetical protein RN50_01083 [Microbacterium foliorum]
MLQERNVYPRIPPESDEERKQCVRLSLIGDFGNTGLPNTCTKKLDGERLDMKKIGNSSHADKLAQTSTSRNTCESMMPETRELSPLDPGRKR